MAGIANLHSLDGDDARAMAVLADARRLMQELRATDDASYTATRMASLRARAGDLEGARLELHIRVGRRVPGRSGAFGDQVHGPPVEQVLAGLVELRRRAISS